MCGLTGFWSFDRTFPEDELARIGAQMAVSLDHRGPDSCTVWTEPGAQLVFGHTRLSIVDLTEMGSQPMVSSSGRSVIAYNGEVYNAEELRDDLIASGRVLRGRSDTEVVLEACEAWGVAKAVERMNGMFAFALWDRPARRLRLVRDRVGVKPLYWGWAGSHLLFGSQPKSFFAHPVWRGEIDHDSIALFLRFNYVPAPFSIYRGIRKLMPGTIIEIDAGGNVQETSYWNTSTIAGNGQADLLAGSDDEITDELEFLLKEAVDRCQVADVPVGILLSGGYDSSTAAALISRLGDENTKAFTIGFEESEKDESLYARAIANHLGLEHHVRILTATEALRIIPRLPAYYDEPLGDSSTIPTFLVSELARAHLPACISGDGGDELFAGYPRYTDDRIPNGTTNGTAEIDRAYRSSITFWEPSTLIDGVVEPMVAPWTPDFAPHLHSAVERMQCIDQCSYLPDDLLAKIDRASMAHGLELRVPYLDHRLIEFAWRLPARMKMREGQGKWVLRRIAHRHVPQQLLDRTKMGFSVPRLTWLRGPLRDWAESLLDPQVLGADGLLDPLPIRRRWEELLAGSNTRPSLLWPILLLQAWRQFWTNAGQGIDRPTTGDPTVADEAMAIGRASAG